MAEREVCERHCKELRGGIHDIGMCDIGMCECGRLGYYCDRARWRNCRMIRFRIFESDRERRPGADEMAWIGTPPLTPVRRLLREKLVRRKKKKRRST